ncbi:MAG: hypothetical protein A2648_02290 [Candidatus Lloydbacteria bacterium RIFCSPHIGHO2_01_FULL_41_20]|uniref:Uncharacterized protein n=1 Tax=Candidatus Lloydbacteria bacterium RIFCSPHIGHO2_01_FULL_41_20 TaxID=1798657 RepID=A0A1G2CRC6_9BACT|nr:MAG: hypothetical protein A2648_02290 [Candidatus Lloydbacteria bacterium RIFCSPHIGHO2_01_FULL_41_20]
MDRFVAYTHVETRTGMGQLVEVACPTGDVQKVKDFFLTSVREVDLPETHSLNVSHGGFGRYTRYDITQHKYAGGGGGYIEVLEIKNPPEGRQGIVINEWNGYDGGVFTEWKTVADAVAAWEATWSGRRSETVYPTMKGFIRRVVCGALSPWFYAIGEEELIGDYALPHGLEDDPVYRLGRKFVVQNGEGDAEIKTCMGTRFYEEDLDEVGYRRKSKLRVRIVYWHDGSIWRGNTEGAGGEPRPLRDDQLWIVKAMVEFNKLLSGRTAEFSVNFIDGGKFVGRFVEAKTPKERKKFHGAGNYLLSVRVIGETKVRKGWVYDFNPTAEDPDILAHVARKLRTQGKEIERLEVKKHKPKKGGKKWVGVYLKPPTPPA